MFDNPRVQKKIIYSLISIFILWVILFEFILPSNYFLPKPLIVWESFGALFKDYGLVISYLSTLAVVYFSLLISYVLVSSIKSFLLNENNKINIILLSIGQISKILPSILFAFLLIYWLPNSVISEFIFAILLSFISFAIKIQNESLNVKQEYISAAKGFGANEKIILNEVKWKSVQPGLMKYIIDFHIYFWTLILFFEYSQNALGLGQIYRHALEFKDLSALIALFIITGMTISLTNIALRHFKTKHFFWD